jgi:microcystin-dependent protein
MAEPFLSEIRMMSFNFAPKGWAQCNGQLLPINQNQALFALLGTTYGGDGQTTFALPNLRGRTPIHFGSGHILGEAAGATAVTITQQTMPTHTHAVSARTDVVLPDAGPQDPTGKFYAAPQVSAQGGNITDVKLYADPSNLQALSPQAVSNTGGSQPHTNMMPFLTINFCIALQGIFPSPN